MLPTQQLVWAYAEIKISIHFAQITLSSVCKFYFGPTHPFWCQFFFVTIISKPEISSRRKLGQTWRSLQERYSYRSLKTCNSDRENIRMRRLYHIFENYSFIPSLCSSALTFYRIELAEAPPWKLFWPSWPMNFCFLLRLTFL